MIEHIYNKFIEANRKISTDSRNVIPGSIFFALHGTNFNGNEFAENAIKSGAITAIVDEPAFHTSKTILVDNSLVALQDLANLYRRKNKFKVIALTGTNGKTTTKELIHKVLSMKYVCHSTQGNFNNHIGVPLTILSAPQEAEMLVVEMGANHVGEIKQLCKIAEPDFGLITNIGKAHLEGFGGFQGVVKAKSELYTYLFEMNGLVFINAADQLLLSLTNNYSNIESYGTADSGFIADKTYYDNGLKTKIHVKNNFIQLNTRLFGNYNITNILAAVKIGSYFNISLLDIAEAINNYNPQNHRSQLINTKKNTLILDSYNANPSSMLAAIESFKEVNSNRKMLILGSMKELGENSRQEHTALIKLARSIKPVKCFLVGKEFLAEDVESEKLFSNTENLFQYLSNNPVEDQLILIKGSRTNKLEDVVDFL
jgi:UDP-N-acetylmuramoyl-tripeptide--D-alanyl-D-alanine ligase